MDTFREHLISFRDRIGQGSERKAAAALGVSNTSFNSWIAGRNFPKPHHVREIAKHLNVFPPYLNALAEAERTPADARMWRTAASRLGRAAALAAVAIGVGATTAPSPAQAAQAADSLRNPVYYVK